jgi:8-oxo-dGTP pyrophosphatase MutT (NUDIX family)
MQVVYTGEEAPKTLTKSIFLAGPTPRNKQEQESWRPDALKILEDKGYDGVVFIPEDRKGEFKLEYDDQVGWEEKYLNMADCIVFWVPRDLTLDSKGYPKMAAFTTNVEFGAWADSGKIVFGAPPEATKNGYLKHYCEKYNVPIGDSLTETLDHAMEMLGDGAERSDGEREVPLFIWKTDSFQSWYKAQTNAGNRLNHARLDYNFRPRYKSFVFLWALKVDVYVAEEDRNKDNELVLARTDISSVLLYRGDEVVVVREFRSPAATEDAFITELPGGSSGKDGEEPEVTAAHEVQEETGFYLQPERLKFIGARQMAGTLSAHKSHLFAAELSKEELDWFKSQKGVVHGNVEDSERTYIEVESIDNLIKENRLDWSSLGMILSVLR